jgi:hypothetical protein
MTENAKKWIVEQIQKNNDNDIKIGLVLWLRVSSS